MKPLVVVVSLLGILPLTLSAQTTSDSNIFNSGSGAATVTVNSEYGESQFHKASVDDRSDSQFFFGDYQRTGGSNTTIDDQLMSLSGFDATTGIDSLRFYDGEQFEVGRVALQVTIYESSSDTTSLNLADYTALNGGNPFTLAVGANGFYIDGTSTNSGTHYDTLTDLGIAAGTQSLLFDFGPERYSTGGSTPANGSDYHVGVGFKEIQGFAAVPEPGTYALLLGGVAALAGFMRLRRSPVR